MIQTVTLRSRNDYGTRFPPIPVGHLITDIPRVVRESVSMAFRRRSTGGGRPPDWLRAAADVRIVEVSGEKSPEIRFDAPKLGDAASALYAQEEFFPSRPDPDDTGFDLLGDVLTDVRESNEDSDRFDDRLLKGLTAFRRVLNGHYQEMLVCGRRYVPEAPAVLDERVIATANSLYSRTPAPVRARVAGILDAARISAQTFGLKLDNGHEVRGVLSAGDFDRVLEFFSSRQRVVVRGDAIFRPSGQLLLIDVDDISQAVGESSVWSRMPEPGEMALDVGAVRRRQGPRSGLAAIIGQWPGEETDEEIEVALGELQ